MNNKNNTPQKLAQVVWTDVRNTLEATLFTGPSERLERLTESLLMQVPTDAADWTKEENFFEMSDFSWLQSALAGIVSQTEDGEKYRKDYTDLLTRAFNAYTCKLFGEA